MRIVHQSLCVSVTVLALVLSLGVAAPALWRPAHAEFVPQPIAAGGVVTEHGKAGTQVAVQWTGKRGQGLGTTPIQIIRNPPGFVRFTAPRRSPDGRGRPPTGI